MYYISYIFYNKKIMLTKNQQFVLDTIVAYMTKNGKAPTIEELRLLLDQKSKRWVTQYLEALEKKWFITRNSSFRWIKLWNQDVKSQKLVPVPVLWYANAGSPLVFADENEMWTLTISKKIINWDKDNFFFLKIEWTSMNDFKLKWKNINNWSYVLINKNEKNINEKDAFLFIVDWCATVKVPKIDWDCIYLMPKSKDKSHKPIIISKDDNIMVNGKVVDVFNF